MAPYKPGESGAEGRTLKRPKRIELRRIRQLFREGAAEAVEALRLVLVSPDSRPADIIRATDMWLTWGFGRPSTWAEDEAAGVPEAFRKLPKDEQKRLLREERAKLERYEASLQSEGETLQ